MPSSAISGAQYVFRYLKRKCFLKSWNFDPSRHVHQPDQARQSGNNAIWVPDRFPDGMEFQLNWLISSYFTSADGTADSPLWISCENLIQGTLWKLLFTCLPFLPPLQITLQHTSTPAPPFYDSDRKPVIYCHWCLLCSLLHSREQSSFIAPYRRAFHVGTWKGTEACSSWFRLFIYAYDRAGSYQNTAKVPNLTYCQYAITII